MSIKFVGEVVRQVFSSDSFKVYGVLVDEQSYPSVQINNYGNVTIMGDLPTLNIGTKYEITAKQESGKYGVSYRVSNIRMDVPRNSTDMYMFLNEILTSRQAAELYREYPDIVDRVKESRLDDIDLSKLYGIKEKMFAKIVRKIEENYVLSDMITEFQGTLTISMVKKMYEKYTSVDRVKEKLKENPYKCLCGLAGVGFKTADGLILDMEKKNIISFDFDIKTSKQRCLACMIYALEENEKCGHTIMNLIDLRKQIIEIAKECVDHFTEVIKDKNLYYEKESLIIGLKSTHDKEVFIANKIKEALSTDTKPWDFNCEKYHMVQGFELSEEQMALTRSVCKNPITVLNGAGGTGKSSSIEAVINMLEDNKIKYIDYDDCFDEGKNEPVIKEKERIISYTLLSPTGKAAKVLADYTKKNAMTIHRGLCYKQDLIMYKDGNMVNDKPYDYATHFAYNRYDKLNVDVVIVDEFSMVDTDLCYHLFEAIDFSNTRLIIVGDNAQLCSVGCGNLLHDFMQSNIIPTITLSKVFRYDEGGLMKVATDIRFCRNPYTKSMKGKATAFGDNKDYIFVDLDEESIKKNAVALFKKLLNEGRKVEDIQVLTAKHVGDCGTVVLNNLLQKVACPNYGNPKRIECGETTYYEGDIIIQNRNNYKAKIYNETIGNSAFEEETFIANGETGIIRKILLNNHLVIDFEGTLVEYEKSDLTICSLGYAITIHKSQGSANKIIILCTPKSHSFMLNSNLLYVGLTRMKEKCYHLGDLATVVRCIGKKENLNRYTSLKCLLDSLKDIQTYDIYLAENKVVSN